MLRTKKDIQVNCKEIGAAQVDEDGSLFLEYVIHKDNYSDNAPRMANCILSQ